MTSITRPAPVEALEPRMQTLHRLVAIARRDLRLTVSYQFQFAMRAVGITFAVASFFFLGELVGQNSEVAGYEGGYFTFVLVGIVVMLFAEVAVKTTGQSFAEAQGDDTLEVLLASPTPLTTLVIGTFVVPMALVTVEATVYFGLAWLFAGYVPTLASALVAVPLIALTVGAFCAFGVFGATVIVLTKRGDPFSSLALQVTNLLAGVLFPVTLLPGALQALARLLPAYYGLRGLRQVLLDQAGLADVAGDLAILLAFDVVLLPVSIWALVRALRFARVAGTLGNR